MIWVNAVVAGILLGGLYALFAAGLSLMFGVMRIINLAHGDLAVVGAYLALVITTSFGVSPFAALPAVVIVLGVAGYVLERLLLERSLRAGILVPLLTTFGLSIVIQNLLLQVATPDSRSLDAGSLTVAVLQVSDQLAVPIMGLITFGVALALLGGLHLLLRYTSLGQSIRATAENADVAELVGIDSRHVAGIAAAIAVGSAGLGGVFFAMRSSFGPLSGPTQLLFAFAAGVIGGVGSVWGTLRGGIVLGVAQTIGAQIYPQYSILAGHLVFLAVLALRGGRFLVGRGSA